jgi:hypothetical protein
MAVTTTVYNLWKQKGDLPDAMAGLALTVSLHTSSYTPNFDTHEFFDDTTNELGTAGGYTAGGLALSNISAALDTGGDFAYVDADPAEWNPLTATFRYAVLFDDTGNPATSRLIMLIDFGASQSPSGIPFAIDWAAPASGGVFKAA